MAGGKVLLCKSMLCALSLTRDENDDDILFLLFLLSVVLWYQYSSLNFFSPPRTPLGSLGGWVTRLPRLLWMSDGENSVAGIDVCATAFLVYNRK